MKRLALVTPLLVLLALSGCAPSQADREATFLGHAEQAAEDAGLDWSDAEREAALEFGRALCTDWAERSTGDRAVDVSGSQASVGFSGESDEIIAARTRYVTLASEDLCPV